MRSEARWCQTRGGPNTNAAGPPVVPNGMRPRYQFSVSLGDPNVMEDPTPMQLRPRRDQSEGGPRAVGTGASVVPKRRRPPHQCCRGLGGPIAAGASVVPKQKMSPHPCGGGLDDPKAVNAAAPMWRGPQRYQSKGGPRAQGARASIL